MNFEDTGTPMSKIADHIPNLLTLGNFLCGCAGIVAAFGQDLFWAAAWIWIGAMFDFLDGFAARLLRVQGQLGVQLDSLADANTFGILPACIVYVIWTGGETGLQWTAFPAFILAASAALRLAKFNIDARQHSSFLGLPTPASALLVSGLPWLHHRAGDAGLWMQQPVFLAVLVLVLSALMLSGIPMFSIKFTGFSWKGNAFRYSFLAFAGILLIALGPAALPIIVIIYVTLSAGLSLSLEKSNGR